MIVITDRHHLPDEAAVADHDAGVGGNRAVMTEHGVMPDLDPSPVLECEPFVDDAAGAEFGCAPL